MFLIKNAWRVYKTMSKLLQSFEWQNVSWPRARGKPIKPKYQFENRKFWSIPKKCQRKQHFIVNDLLLNRSYNLSTALLAISGSINPWSLNRLWTDRIATPVVLGGVLYTLVYRNRKTLRLSDRILSAKVHIRSGTFTNIVVIVVGNLLVESCLLHDL